MYLSSRVVVFTDNNIQAYMYMKQFRGRSHGKGVHHPTIFTNLELYFGNIYKCIDLILTCHRNPQANWNKNSVCSSIKWCKKNNRNGGSYLKDSQITLNVESAKKQQLVYPHISR